MIITEKTRGIHKNVPNHVYHGDLIFHSSSNLKLALKDPKAYYEERILGKPSTSIMNQGALDLGSYIHTMFLEPWKLNDEYIIWHGDRKQGNKWEEFKAFYEKQGKVIISLSQKNMADKLAESFRDTEIEIGGTEVIKGPALFTGGEPEESVFTELDGLLIKARSDYRITNHKHKWILDVKSTSQTANTPQEAKKIMYSLGYDLSAALYKDAFDKETGECYDFLWAFFSKDDFKINLYKMSQETYNEGKDKYKRAIEMIHEWKRTGEYYNSKLREI